MFIVGVLQGLASEGLLGLRSVVMADPSATGNAAHRLPLGNRPPSGAVLTCLDGEGSVEVEVEVVSKGEAPRGVPDPSGEQFQAQGLASSAVNLSPEQFARVFPFYMVLDLQGNLMQVRMPFGKMGLRSASAPPHMRSASGQGSKGSRASAPLRMLQRLRQRGFSGLLSSALSCPLLL